MMRSISRRLAAGLAVAGGLGRPRLQAAERRRRSLLAASLAAVDGFFGTFDRAALQRGFQVYQNVCQNCHSLKYLAFRNLEGLGYNEDEIKAIAAQYQITDGPTTRARCSSARASRRTTAAARSPTSRRRAPPTAAPCRRTCR